MAHYVATENIIWRAKFWHSSWNSEKWALLETVVALTVDEKKAGSKLAGVDNFEEWKVACIYFLPTQHNELILRYISSLTHQFLSLKFLCLKTQPGFMKLKFLCYIYFFWNCLINHLSGCSRRNQMMANQLEHNLLRLGSEYFFEAVSTSIYNPHLCVSFFWI